jgi:siroheme synthase-like protein
VSAGYYPVFLDLEDRACLVVGGGPVAERKVESLLAVGARVTVVSPTVTARLAARAAAGRIAHRARAYRAGDLAGVRIVFVAADADAVTRAVVTAARARGVWVNAADEPARCDFILPSVIRRGHLAVAVSTGGASPAAARAVRRELEGYLTERHAALVDLAADARADLRTRGVSASPRRWQRALGDRRVRRLIAGGRYRRARRMLVLRLESA